MRSIFVLLVLLFTFFFRTAHAGDHADSQNISGLLRFEASDSVAATMDRLEAAITQRGFKVFARIDHQAGARSIDMDLRPTQLLIFGNPEGGTPLMQNAQTMGIDLPLKALVYEAENGQVFVAFNDPHFLVHRHSLKNGEAITKKMTGLITALAKAATASD
ncbi:membrane protein [Iodidimonas muriae]|uniref:Membrane protein n=1 Tax=Iodidimonas muriae TaxID=261467 RepID=A0ABQ2LCK6_9PROT|nr:DUF302 domain-containing protein [Iodidimonas muriae]GER07365.1 membrane protein [Kordiimonadales bacterium JCM 17843]GGO10796.1 membrane protein [Iodidimonas muriae]